MSYSMPAADVDTIGCADEPIRIPGSIQPHGFLLAVSEPDLRVVQASANAGEILGFTSAASLSGKRLPELFSAEIGCTIASALEHEIIEERPRQLGNVNLADGRQYLLLAHRRNGRLIAEFERIESVDTRSTERLYAQSTEFVAALQSASDIQTLQNVAMRQVRKLSGFDRVLLYQFDEAWHGTVVAEDGNDRLPKYLGLRFPAEDIPVQARELYRLNRIRLIVNADYRPAPIEPTLNPATGEPLDLTFATLRSVSPIHLQYMRNMGTPASMSISVVSRGRLWGLISCHHSEPRNVPFPVRTACEFVGQILALQIETNERAAEAERRVELKSLQSQLLAAMAAHGPNFIDGLVAEPETLLKIVGATGAAVVDDIQFRTAGKTPDESQLRRLTHWLAENVEDEVFATDSIGEALPEFAELAPHAAGMAAVAVSKLYPGYVLWFRPERATTVAWAGDPRKPPKVPGQETLHPRKSFEIWKETVRGRSLPFHAAELEALTELRNSIIGIVLRRAEETAELSAELQRSNKELEAFSYSVSHDLRAPFRHIVGFSELLRERAVQRLTPDDRRYLEIIAESAQTAGQLVDNLLSYSRMGRSKLEKHAVDLNEVFAEAQRRHARRRQAHNSLEYRPAADDFGRRLNDALRGTELAFQCRQVYTRNRRGPHCRSLHGTRERVRDQRARQRRRLRYGVRRQTVRRLSTYAQNGGLRRDRHRAGKRAANHRASRRSHLGDRRRRPRS
ncbi:MAG: GAF domain-containing protein [Pirellulales bacterium]